LTEKTTEKCFRPLRGRRRRRRPTGAPRTDGRGPTWGCPRGSPGCCWAVTRGDGGYCRGQILGGDDMPRIRNGPEAYRTPRPKTEVRHRPARGRRLVICRVDVQRQVVPDPGASDVARAPRRDRPRRGAPCRPSPPQCVSASVPLTHPDIRRNCRNVGSISGESGRLAWREERPDV